MKKGFLLFAAVMAFLTLALSGCASIKILTPDAIESDIGGEEYLRNCQFYISKEVVLRFLSDNRETEVNEFSGVVEAQRVITRRTIKIPSSTPGILQTRNNAGDVLRGFSYTVDRGIHGLSILFEDDDDNALYFTNLMIGDWDDFRFCITENEVEYDGVTYTLSYNGDEVPYLMYKLLEQTREDIEVRKAKGRRVRD